MKCYKWIDQSVLQCHLTTLKSQRSNSYKTGIKKTTIIIDKMFNNAVHFWQIQSSAKET